MPNARFWRRVVVLAAGALALTAGSPVAHGAPEPRARYIVVLNPSVSRASDVALEHARRFGAQPDYVYENALKGYAATLPLQAIQGLSHDPRVAYVEADAEVFADATQTGATWGIDRIDQRSLPLSGTYSYASTGAGVTAYVIDTGILRSHAEFGGRAVTGYDAVTSGGSAADCNGHGTHVAGTIGGATYGVAKSVTLVAVRVLGCNGSGTTSGVIAGIDWVTGNHASGAPAVANMSLGGGASTALDDAVRRSIADGVSYAIAAGNGNRAGVAQDACKSSPARVTEAMTISAADKTDRKASWANYGSCVDWFAPGVSITSAWYTSTTATNTISGTSMATPHTAGAAALYLETNPGASPGAVRDALDAQTTKGIVSSSKTVNNNLLYTGP
jgi:subtilisin family serine protease